MFGRSTWVAFLSPTDRADRGQRALDGVAAQHQSRRARRSRHSHCRRPRSRADRHARRAAGGDPQRSDGRTTVARPGRRRPAAADRRRARRRRSRSSAWPPTRAIAAGSVSARVRPRRTSRSSTSTSRTRSGRMRWSPLGVRTNGAPENRHQHRSRRDRGDSIRPCRSTTSRRWTAACATEEAPVAFAAVLLESVWRCSRSCSRRSVFTACSPRRSRAAPASWVFAPRSARIRAGWSNGVMSEGLKVSATRDQRWGDRGVGAGAFVQRRAVRRRGQHRGHAGGSSGDPGGHGGGGQR